jgi:hypothetical protein
MIIPKPVWAVGFAHTGFGIPEDTLEESDVQLLLYETPNPAEF